MKENVSFLEAWLAGWLAGWLADLLAVAAWPVAGWLPLAGWLVGWQAGAHFCHWSLLILTFSKMSIKILNISKDVWQKWNMVKNDESVVAPKCWLFHGKYNNFEKWRKSWHPWTRQNLSISLEISKVTKIGQTHAKRGTPKRLIVTCVFEDKSMLGLEKEKGELQKCYKLLSFLKDFDDNDGPRKMTHFDILSMAGTTATFWHSLDEGWTWRTLQSALSRLLEQDSENRWFENVKITADVWQKLRSYARGKTNTHQAINKMPLARNPQTGFFMR